MEDHNGQLPAGSQREGPKAPLATQAEDYGHTAAAASHPAFAHFAALQFQRPQPHTPAQLQLSQDLAHHPEQSQATLQALLQSSGQHAPLPHAPVHGHTHESSFSSPQHPHHEAAGVASHTPHPGPRTAAPAQEGAGHPFPNAVPGHHLPGPSTSTPFSSLTLDDLRSVQGTFAAERDWDKFHTPRNLVLALVSEVGELAEVFQWKGDAAAARGLPGFTAGERVAVQTELSDVLLYLVRLADVCGIDLAAAAIAKLEENARKYPADRVRGSSAKYTAYADLQSTGGAHLPLAHPPLHGVHGHAAHHPSALHGHALGEYQHGPVPADSAGGSGDRGVPRISDSKRKRFSEAQVTALEKLAAGANWRLQNVPKAMREQFCSEWDISQDRLHNFINNRKPKDLKKPRSIRSPTLGGSTDALEHEEEGQNENGDGRNSESPEPEASHRHPLAGSVSGDQDDAMEVAVPRPVTHQHGHQL